ncbi:hypothetical protein [Candidatus Albibeggiatoa sp. nov. BB20]|uniref:hypothetical protein n=1 Tax=Candidatus Albibeggiatoa sp. nov. BB20 TaxID=3162723 RepID=UPI0033656370
MKQALFIFGLLIMSLSSNSFAIPDVGSREYKLMLNPRLFEGVDPTAAVTSYWGQLKSIIEAEPIGRDSRGSFSLDKLRTVKFYDTPTACTLKSKGYTFRERVENGEREVTLKYRAYDRFIAGYKDMQGEASRHPETKFEEDISAPFVSKYSHSTTQSIGDNKNLNKMDDPIGLYPSLEAYGFDPDMTISLVNNLVVTEKVYKGTSVDLGNLNAEFALTLWYDSEISSNPMIAEVSFKYKDANEDYSENVVARALQVFEAMQTMTSWTSSSSLTKTAFVFSYATPNFCQ